MNGLFLIGREMFDHPVVGIHKPKRFAAWCWLLGEARYKPHRIMVAGEVVNLERGQLSCSIRFMAKRCGMSVQEIRTLLNVLKTNTMINIDSNTGQNVITICNYDTYQDFDKYSTQLKAQLPTRQQHSSNTAATQTRTKVTKETKEYSEDFNIFWKEYPRKISKAPAWKAFQVAIKIVSLEDILLGIKAYIKGKAEYADWQHPATWLNARGWENEYETLKIVRG